MTKNDETIDVCFDIDVDVNLINENFFRRQNFDVSIRKMIIFLTIRDFDTNQHETINYVICFLYFENTQKNDVFFKIIIRRKMHLISHFKINMLIKNDIIIFENIVIDSTKKQIHIDNCDIIVFVKIRFRNTQTQQRFIHAKKIIILSSRNQLIISIHQFNDELFENRDFFFEFDDTKFIFYVHLIDFFIKIVLISNDIDKIIKIFRNYRLNKFVEFDYSHVFHIDNENESIQKLTIRTFKSNHKFF